MTARPPVETQEASSEGSSDSLETGDSQTSPDAQDAADPKLRGGAGDTGAGKLNRSEPSMSRTLEAILSKSDADDDLSVPPQDDEAGGEGGDSIGTRTLLGIGPSGLPLPPRVPRPDHSSDDEHSFSVEDVFDDEGTAVSSVRSNGKGQAAKGGDDQVGDLLDEVAEALHTQASSHDSTVGALPGKPVPAARPIRADVAPTRGDHDEFEFEDPDDGPTTLNAHGDIGEDVDVGSDDDDEAVVLGPARLPPSRPVPALPGRLTLPPSTASGTISSATKTATPFAGLAAATLPSFPAPASGRSRLPTPAPGQAIGLPPPGRGGLPAGTPVNGVPATASQGDSSRRSTSGRAASGRAGAGASDKSAGHHATAVVMESLTSAMESASVVLKKDVKFRVASLAGVVVATFVVGLLIGRAVMGSGKKTTAEASQTVVANEEAKAAAPPAKAPAEVPPAPAAAPAAPAPVGQQEAAPAAPPPEQVPAIAPSLAEAPLPPTVHKRRARRANLVPKEEPLPKPVAARPVAPAPRAKASPVAQTGKKKSTWHDPFAD